MISQTRQRLAMGAMIAVAVAAIALGAAYQDDDKLGDAGIVGAGTSSSTTAPSGGIIAPAPEGSAATGQPSESGPIEAWLPLSGEASACSEEIGIDLVPGYGATLTINGIPVPPEEMNVNLDPDGEISDVITASRSLGRYTFEADDDCPNGRYLRPVGNLLEVCVYQLSDDTNRCILHREHVFDAL